MKIEAYLTDKYENNKLQKCELEKCNEYSDIIKIDTTKTFQNFIGFGGAFTEASGYNLSRVNYDLRKEALKKYFSEEGLNYNLGRIAIGGCDFSLGPYSYLINDEELSLENFSIERDKKYIIPMIKEAEEIAQKKINILASPWSPPKQMKDNKSFIHGGKLLKEYYPLYSQYLLKFVDKYEEQGINIFAITLQNEPAAKQRWDSCLYDAEEERDLLNYVGPLFLNNKPNIKIYVWDHNRDIVLDRVKPIYTSNVEKYAYGTAIHWYDNEPYTNLDIHHQLYPNKHLIHTEGCIEGGVKFSTYETGERYGRNIIGNFNNFVEGFIDWNLFLDETGGPNWVNNLCDAPIIINVNMEKLILQTSYYYIGHFSKFIKLNAKKVEISNSNKLLSTAFINPNGDIIVIIQNENEQNIDLLLEINSEKEIFKIKKRSIITLICKRGESYE